jgi:hypothetical protein
MKQKIKLTEQDLHNIIMESVKQYIAELDARTYANYAREMEKRRDNAKDNEEWYEYQRKANRGKSAAIKDWNKRFGYENDFATQRMGSGFDEAPYDITYKNKKNGDYVAYNPRIDSEFISSSNGRNVASEEHPYKHDYGDNGAHAVAYQMAHPKAQNYIKGKGYYNGDFYK